MPSRSHGYRSPFLLVSAVAVLASGCVTVASVGAGESSTWRFEARELATGVVGRPTVLTGFFSDPSLAEVAVVHVDEEGRRRLQVYPMTDGAGRPRLDTVLRPRVLFVDVAKLGGTDRLVTYEPGRLSWFDPGSMTEGELAAVNSSFAPPRREEVPHVDVTRDVNRDGRDDLVVPDVDGFWIVVQKEDGTFAEPLKAGPPADLSRIYGADGYRYDPWSQSRIHSADLDLDGRQDLVHWSGERFAVHLQDERGGFNPLAETFASPVAFDSDDPDRLAEGAMTGRVWHSLADLDGDGVADLGILELAGERVADKRSVYEVHLGRPAPDGGTVFEREVDFAFRSEDRVQLGMERHDFDGDGRVDLLFTTIEVRFLTGSLWKRLKGAMGDDVWLELEFYRNHGGRFGDAPDAVRRIALDGAPSHREPGWVPLDVVLRGATHEKRRERKIWPRAFNPTLLVGDVTGDGRSDLLLERSHRELHVYAGQAGAGLFVQKPQVVSVSVPHDTEYTWLVDLDRNGKQDVVFHHPYGSKTVHGGPIHPTGTEPHRVTLLLSR